MNAFRFFLLFILVCYRSLGQTKPARLDTVYCDCANAREVKITGNNKIGPTIPPPGSGQKIEITAGRLRTPYVFEKEHHSAWYKLVLSVGGNLSFDIFPTNPLDDYDFTLFKAGINNFCDSLEKYRVKPLRSNISRDKNEIQGKTGLSLKARHELVKEGVNDAYSSSLKVEKGGVYYLVLDNVYENGDGHTINFFFEQKVEIKGVVKDDEEKPLITSVTVADAKGEIVAETMTDPKTGAYDLNAILRKNVSYSLNYFNDSSFVFSKTITLKDTSSLKDLKVILPRLRKGKKYPLGAINFYGNSAEYLPSAIPVIKNLYKLMEKNKNLSIQIEGYINCAHDGKQFGVIDEITLPKERAGKIRDFLIRNKINSSRVQSVGIGCRGMLYPNAKTPAEEEANRRVEIKVLEF